MFYIYIYINVEILPKLPTDIPEMFNKINKRILVY